MAAEEEEEAVILEKEMEKEGTNKPFRVLPFPFLPFFSRVSLLWGLPYMTSAMGGSPKSRRNEYRDRLKGGL